MTSFDFISKFEQELASYTGAPYAIMTDCCTHAIELCLRYERVKECLFTPFTYLSVPMTMHKLGIEFEYLGQETQQWVGEYQFINTRIWDSARRLEPGMYKPGSLMCLSFGHSKPLEIGHGGAILLDDPQAYKTILRQRYDGRDLTILPWQTQVEFELGFHYKPTIEDAIKGLERLPNIVPQSQQVDYPDCRKIYIKT
jgi:dTDP-4-amino-4,6-dideoxygalactose transaminase